MHLDNSASLPSAAANVVDSAARERQRIEAEYNRRAEDPALRRRYAALQPDCLFALQRREAVALRLLRRFGFNDLSEVRLLDVGCGGGDPLLRWLGHGLEPENCAGIDLLEPRLARARRRLPAAVKLFQGDASQLPFADHSFDLVTQFTVFSSILDPGVRRALAREMARVLHPAGLILWYDFWLNPGNRQTRGIRPREIRALFPGGTCALRRITLAPPLARRLAPLSLFACEALERLKVFNSHYLAVIRPERTGPDPHEKVR